jgi:hypothetical protein
MLIEGQDVSDTAAAAPAAAVPVEEDKPPDTILGLGGFGDAAPVILSLVAAMIMSVGLWKGKDFLAGEGEASITKVMGIKKDNFIILYLILMVLAVVGFGLLSVGYANATKAGKECQPTGGSTNKTCTSRKTKGECEALPTGCKWDEEAFLWWWTLPYLITMILWFFLLSAVIFSSMANKGLAESPVRVIAWLGIILMIVQLMSRNYVIEKCELMGVDDRYIRYIDTLFWPILFMLFIGAISFSAIQVALGLDKLTWKKGLMSLVIFFVLMWVGILQLMERGQAVIFGGDSGRKETES